MSRFKILSLLSFCIALLVSCSSIKKYNEIISNPISVKDMHHDIRKVERRLFRMHPDIDLYISKDSLKRAFSLLKEEINQPMMRLDFYFKLAPIVAKVRQGHTVVLPPSKKLEQDEKDKLKGSIGPLSQWELIEENNKFYIIKDATIDTSLILGSELLSINNMSIRTLKDIYKNIIVGDGYSDAYYSASFPKIAGLLYTRIYGMQDTIILTLKYADSIFNKTIYRNYKHEIDSIKQVRHIIAQKVSDSLASLASDTVSIDSTLIAKEMMNESRILKYGINRETNDYNITLDYSDSNVAILTIKVFSQVLFHKSIYSKIFDSLKANNIHNLIIDLRGNPGGVLNEIHTLHSYITKDSLYRTISENTLTLTKYKMPFWSLVNTPILAYPIAIPFIWIDGIVYASRTKSNGDGTYTYKMKQSKLTPSQPNKYNGDIWMLIDGGTFSAAAITAANFKNEKRGILIGSETGGAANGAVAGKMPMYKLKKSKLHFRVGTMSLHPAIEMGEYGRGVKPDIYMKNSLNDYLQQKDVLIDYIKNEIHKKSEL
jgi:C-terminal processing protease CtpA/Prc